MCFQNYLDTILGITPNFWTEQVRRASIFVSEGPFSPRSPYKRASSPRRSSSNTKKVRIIQTNCNNKQYITSLVHMNINRCMTIRHSTSNNNHSNAFSITIHSHSNTSNNTY